MRYFSVINCKYFLNNQIKVPCYYVHKINLLIAKPRVSRSQTFSETCYIQENVTVNSQLDTFLSLKIGTLINNRQVC